MKGTGRQSRRKIGTNINKKNVAKIRREGLWEVSKDMSSRCESIKRVKVRTREIQHWVIG